MTQLPGERKTRIRFFWEVTLLPGEIMECAECEKCDGLHLHAGLYTNLQEVYFQANLTDADRSYLKRLKIGFVSCVPYAK